MEVKEKPVMGHVEPIHHRDEDTDGQELLSDKLHTLIVDGMYPLYRWFVYLLCAGMALYFIVRYAEHRAREKAREEK